MSRRYTIGSVSSGTMRPEDLIPEFVSVLDTLKDDLAMSDVARIDSLLAAIETRQQAEDYYESEDAYFDLEELTDELNALAPPYFYFGSHPGDGADYGFWLADDVLEDFDGLRVADLAEVPSDYRGEVLLVNDHGNATLYTTDDGDKFVEVWSVV